MMARTARPKAGPADPREALAAAAYERGDSLAALSRMLDRRSGYLADFVREGIPTALTPRDHTMLVDYFGKALGVRDLWDRQEAAPSGARPKPDRAMDLENMRSLGIRSIALSCCCGRNVEVNVDRFPGHYEVPTMKRFFRCAECGQRPNESRPNTRDMRRNFRGDTAAASPRR